MWKLFVDVTAKGTGYNNISEVIADAVFLLSLDAKDKLTLDSE